MSDRSLVKIFMERGNVTVLGNKLSQDSISPIDVNAVNKASEIKKGQQSITDNEVIGIQTYGTLEQMKKNFTTKLMDGNTENIHLSDQRAKLYCMMNENKDLPLKGAPKIDIVKMGMIKQSGKDFN